MSPTHIVPERIAPDAWLITELFPGAPGAHVPVRSLVLTGREPVIVDTGTSLNRHAWTEAVFSIVEPRDVRWIYLSHDDHDHVGNLAEVLGQCPSATLVANWFMAERLAGDLPLPLHRMRWVNDGDSFDAGDRILHAVRPPVFDSPTTRGLFDPLSGVYWASDAFASMVTPGATDAVDIDAELWQGTFLEMNRQIAPWVHLVEPHRFGSVVDRITALGATTVVGAHGAVLRREHIGRSLDLMRRLPELPEVVFPGQLLLDEILATMAPTAA
jgi:flavorubredoxin